MLLAEQRRQHVVSGVAKLGLHLLPLADHTLLDGAAHMPRPWTVLEVALDAAAFIRSALAALQTVSPLIDHASKALAVLVKPDLRCPIHTDRMSPLKLLASDRLDQPF